MHGKIDFEIKNTRISFKHTFERNITILRGDSATGKTTMIDMVRGYENEGKKSGIKLKCNKECRVLEGKDWERKLEGIHDSLIFIDEGNAFIQSKKFAEKLQKSDNYYIIATRSPLYNLPYSIESIFEIKTSAKKHTFKKIYNKISINDFFKNIFELIITEDSKSGFYFFKNVKENTVTAEGKSNLLRTLKSHKNDKVLIIADGAALGSEIEALVEYENLNRGKVYFMLPESFEWMILKSGLIAGVENILQNPSDYIYCEKYISWERYFTDLLINKTKNIEYMQYKKTKLVNYYTNDTNIKKILNSIK